MLKMNFRTLSLIMILLVSLTLARAAAGKQAVSKQTDTNMIHTDSIVALGKAGWKTPPPPYPYAARYQHNEGKIYMEMSTDAKGHILKATILKVDKSANSASLRSTVLLWAWYHWSGPPNSKATVYFQFKMI